MFTGFSAAPRPNRFGIVASTSCRLNSRHTAQNMSCCRIDSSGDVFIEAVCDISRTTFEAELYVVFAPLNGNPKPAPREARALPVPEPVAARTGAILLLGAIVLILLTIRFVDHPLATLVFHKRFHGALFRTMPPEIAQASLFAAFLLLAILVWTRVSGLSIWRKAIGLSLASAAIAYGSTNYFLKPLFGRSGPMLWVWHNTDSFRFFSRIGADSYFFPSGHAAFVTALMTSVTIVLPEFRAISLAIPSFTAFILVVLEEHFLSDALAGMVVGTCAALIVSWTWRRFSSIASRYL